MEDWWSCSFSLRNAAEEDDDDDVSGEHEATEDPMEELEEPSVEDAAELVETEDIILAPDPDAQAKVEGGRGLFFSILLMQNAEPD